MLATVLLLTACSGGDDDDSADKGSSDSDSSNSRTDGRDPTPMDAFWSSVGGDEDSAPSEEEMAEQERQVQQKIVECMQALGFEYTPVDYGGMVVAAAAEEDDGPWSLPPDEFAERYGYGMYTMDNEAPVAEDMPEDPNQDRMEQMSDAERTAYEEALYGKYDEESDEAISEGCSTEAYNTIYGEDTTDYDQFNGLFDDMDALWQRIGDDPRVVDAIRAWRDCMADAGYPDLEAIEDASTLVTDKHNELTPGDDDDMSEEGVFTETSSSGDVRIVGGGGPTDELDPEALQELRDFEIAVAVADHGCQEDGDDGYAQVYYDVQCELEQQFIDEHQDELDRYREAMAASPGVG